MARPDTRSGLIACDWERFMQSFFSEQNLARYKKLASGAVTALERKAIFEFLAKERADLRDHWNARFEGAHVAAERGHLIRLGLKAGR
jgi:hypothetical protein